MSLQGLSIIGARRGAGGGKPFAGIDAATGTALPVEFHSASSTDVDDALRLASDAFVLFAQWSGARRGALLRRIADGLQTAGADIVARGTQETGLPGARLEGELVRTCFQLRLCAEAAESGLFTGVRIDHADPERKPMPKPDLRSMMRPIGPVVVFGASNFPLAFSVAGGDTAAALAAGCPVVVKAHPAHPGTSELVGVIIQQSVTESTAPDGVFSMLFDAGYEVGTALVKHPLTKAVAFTGSRHGGRALMDHAAARPEPIPVFAEMSSINPVFILQDALAEKSEELATGLHGSLSLGVGQFCTNPGLVFVEAGEATKRFLATLETLVTATPPGTMLTAGICEAYRKGVERLSTGSGVKRLAAAEPLEGKGSATVFSTDAKTFLNDRSLMDEVFGPSSLVVECSSREQMLEAARGIEGQLTATIHASPDGLAANRNLIEILSEKVGRLLFNGFPTGVEVTHAMVHGGPYPATSDGRSTSVGTRAIERFLRPVSYQSFPDAALPPELQEANPLKVARLVDGKWDLN